MTVRVAELESVFTGNVEAFEKAAVRVETRRKNLGKTPAEVQVTADTKAAEAGMARVEADAKRLTSKDVVAKIDANITAAEKKAASIRTDLAVLDAMDTTPEVTADIAKAMANLARTESALKALQGTRAKLEVEADTSKAEEALDGVADKAGAAGSKAGEAAGSNLAGGVVAAIATIPVAGAIVGVGAAIGKALMDGLQVEVRSDLLTARTGLDEATVAKVARVAGEAYADNFGESIASNMETARSALQSGLLDPAATARDSEAVVESLDGVATILGEEIPRVARSTAQLLRTGLAKDAAGAFDIIVKGQQAGLNVSEDWLDTLDEYSTQFRKLGIDGGQATGLLYQAVRAGARDTDTAADALKEFAIRAVDGSTTTAAGFKGIGLSAQDMAAKIAAGGASSAEALDTTLDRLRAVEDPATRAQIAVALFGTKAEDLGDALYAMDLTTAIDQLGQVDGVARSAVEALGDNAAGTIASAQRNIEVAADGIKGALAAAFNPQIEEFGTFVAENREQVMTFLLDLANGGLDMGRSIVEGIASGTEAVGAFIAGPLADLVDALGDVVLGIDAATPGDQGGKAFRKWADESVTSLRKVDDGANAIADTLRTNLITNAIDPAQAKLNEVAIPLIAQAAVHDASVRLASSIDGIGYAADGSKLALDAMNGGVNLATDAGRQLDEQLRSTVEALDAEATAGAAAGETQDELTARYQAGRDALVAQLEQMGYTTAQAQALADTYAAIPGKVETIIAAQTTQAQADVDALIARNQGKVIRLTAEVSTSGNPVYITATGARMEADGDVLTKMPTLSPIAQMVRPGTLKIVGDAKTDEAFIPLNGSARSLSLLDESARRLGRRVMPLAVGSVLSSQPSSAPAIGATAPAAAPQVAVVVRIGDDELDAWVDERASKAATDRMNWGRA